jgi:hypothetical protein
MIGMMIVLRTDRREVSPPPPPMIMIMIVERSEASEEGRAVRRDCRTSRRRVRQWRFHSTERSEGDCNNYS